MSRPETATVVGLSAWVALVAVQLGWIGPMRHQWAFDLWAYLPPALGPALGALALPLCLAGPRRRVAAAVRTLAERAGGLPIRVVDALVFAGTSALLFALREPHIYGDAFAFVHAARTGRLFVFPEIGATFAFGVAARLGALVGVGPYVSIQLLVCACGGLAFVVARRLAAEIAPRSGAGPLVVLVLLGSGLARIFAGHAEVYALLASAVLVHARAVLGWMRGRTSWRAVGLTLGLAVWIHTACLTLAPALAWIAWAAPAPANAERVRRLLVAGAWSAAPGLVFLAGLVMLGPTEDLARAFAKATEVAGQSDAESAVRWWVRGWGGEPSVGTDYVFLSGPHLKYHLNALQMLAPLSVPLLLVAARRGALAPARRTLERSWLLVAAGTTVVYALVLRPFWGPYDWDLFTITALLLSASACHLLAASTPAERLREWLALGVALQLAFVTLPFLLMESFEKRDGGPFHSGFSSDIIRPATAPPEEIAEWF